LRGLRDEFENPLMRFAAVPGSFSSAELRSIVRRIILEAKVRAASNANAQDL